jgi:hypothetical protein
MFPELSIERIFRREIESLPLPDERLWVPKKGTTRLAIVAWSVVGAALLLVLVVAGVIRDRNGAATQPSGAVQPPASCEPSAFGASGRCLSLLPNLFRNQAYGYNLTFPAGWREVQMPVGTEPFVRDQPSADPSLTAPFLLDRHVFTARSARDWAGTAGNLAPAWDLDVQVWDRQGRTALDWSRAFPCGAPVAFGDTRCVRSEEPIHGMTATVTTVFSFRWHITSYYLERGDQMVILRYMYSEMSQPPLGVLPSVAEDTLQQVVRSIGLV